MVNWARVCHPLSFGGLGVRDLHRVGIALRMRWLWLQRTDPRRPWAKLHLPSDPDANAMFRATTTWTVGDGLNCRFWTDHWINGSSVAEIAPLIFAQVPRRRRKDRTVRDGLHHHSWVQDIQGALGPMAML